jgi:hypothetical protein
MGCREAERGDRASPKCIVAADGTLVVAFFITLRMVYNDVMTQKLHDVLEKASALPEALQEQLAEQLLEDIEGELAWDQTLVTAKSQELLDRLADKAITAHKQGRAHRRGFGSYPHGE